MLCFKRKKPKQAKHHPLAPAPHRKPDFTRLEVSGRCKTPRASRLALLQSCQIFGLRECGLRVTKNCSDQLKVAFSAIKSALSWTTISKPFRSCWKGLSFEEADDLLLLRVSVKTRLACFLISGKDSLLVCCKEGWKELFFVDVFDAKPQLVLNLRAICLFQRAKTAHI